MADNGEGMNDEELLKFAIAKLEEQQRNQRKGLFETSGNNIEGMMDRAISSNPIENLVRKARDDGQQSFKKDQMITRFGQQPTANDMMANGSTILRTPMDQGLGDGATLGQKEMKSQRFMDMIKTSKQIQEGNPLTMEELLMRFHTNPVNRY